MTAPAAGGDPPRDRTARRPRRRRAPDREGTIELEVLDVLASEERVMLLVRERFTLEGETLIIRRANVYRIRNGRISAIEIYGGDQDIVDELLP